MTYKFMQISDIGFNNSLCINQAINEYVEILRKKAFENMINLCVKEKVTALLICGNLFDEKNITVENVTIIKKGFAKLKAHSIAIIYARGFLDKGALVPSISKGIIDFSHGFDYQDYALPYDIDSITFVGSGYDKSLLSKKDTLKPKKPNVLEIGLLYINNQAYERSEKEAIHNMLAETNVDYWALGGEIDFVKPSSDLSIGYCGFPVPVQGIKSGCLLVEINNKGKIETKLLPICNVKFKNLYIDGLDQGNDVYILIQKCVLSIQEFQTKNNEIIASIKLIGPCNSYNNVVNHIADIEKQVAKITRAHVEINTSMLYKNITIDDDVENDSDLNELLKKCYKLYDDNELYKDIVNSIKQKKVFYSEGSKAIDKKQILEGLDSILIESALKEDINDN